MALALLGRALLSRNTVSLIRATLGVEEALEGPEDIEIPVSSSAIRSIGWRSDGVISVTFHRGGTYSYDGDYATFVAFAASPSKGEFFNAYIK